MKTIFALVADFFKREWFLLIALASIVLIFALFEMAV
jgi:hypothetical protein